MVQHFTTDTVYINPKRAHWPVYDEAASYFVKAEQGEQRLSMCDLTLEEAKSLELVTLFCDYEKQRGKFGKAST